MTKFLVCTPFLLIGATLFLLPNMTRRGTLFAVTVAPDFLGTREARHAIAFFRLVMAIALAGGLSGLLALPPGLFSTIAPLALAVVGVAAYYKANRLIAPFATRQDGERSMELSAIPERLPRFIWLIIGPFVILALAAIVLREHWDGILARFPVHWGVDGMPNRWVDKTVKGVYGPLFFGAELCAWFTVFTFAGWFGARRTSARPIMLGIGIAAEYFIALLFAAIALQLAMGFPIWVVLAPVLLLPLPLIVFAIKKLSEPSDPAEKTPDECWKFAMIYYNPNDAALFVEKRMGLGYTVNMANPWSWALLGGLLLLIASAPLVLK